MTAASIIEARNFVFTHRADYAAAYGGFRRPQLAHFS